MLRTREFLPYVVFVAPTDYSAEENGSGALGGTLRSCTIDNLKMASKVIFFESPTIRLLETLIR